MKNETDDLCVVLYQVGASVFASNIGSEHFIGLAGSGKSFFPLLLRQVPFLDDRHHIWNQ